MGGRVGGEYLVGGRVQGKYLRGGEGWEGSIWWGEGSIWRGEGGIGDVKLGVILRLGVW